MNDLIAFVVALLVAGVLCAGGTLMLVSPDTYLRVQDWVTRAERWGLTRERGGSPGLQIGWRLAGVTTLAMGTIVARMLVFWLMRGHERDTSELAEAEGHRIVGHWVSLFLPVFLVALGLWIIITPRPFVRWALRAHTSRTSTRIDFERLGSKELLGIRAFGVVFLIGGIVATIGWYKGG